MAFSVCNETQGDVKLHFAAGMALTAVAVEKRLLLFSNYRSCRVCMVILSVLRILPRNWVR